MSEALEAILPTYIDSTMLSCFRSCPRKYYYEFVLGLRPSATSIDLHAGGCFAHAMEVFSLAFHRDKRGLAQSRALTLSAFEREWGDVEAPHGSPKDKDNVWLAFESYLRAYPPEIDHVQPYMVNGKPTFEFTFAIPLTSELDGREWPLHPSGDPFLYSGRFDTLGTYNGRPCVKDEKTAKAAGATWADQWNLRGQLLGYCWACQVSGIPVNTVVIRGVIIQKRDIKQLEAIKIYEQDLIDRWLEQLRRDLWRLRCMWDENYFDLNFAEACTAYGSCPFMPIDQHSLPAESWASNYTVRRWNPLAKNPIDETLLVPSTKGLAA